jgi:hypothetical protein
MCGDTTAGMEWFEGLISGDREYKLDTIVPEYLLRATHFGTAKAFNGACAHGVRCDRHDLRRLRATAHQQGVGKESPSAG